MSSVLLRRFRIACKPCRKLWAITVPESDADLQTFPCPMCEQPCERAAGMEDLD